MSFPFVDVHSHFLPDFYREALRATGHHRPDGAPIIPEWSKEAHLAFMEEHNVRKAYLSVSTPGTFLTAPNLSNTTSPTIATPQAVTLTRKVNDYGSSLKREYPDRFGFFASLPLPDVDAAITEVERIERERLAIDGFVLLTNAHGLYIGDPRMQRLLSKLDTLHAVIFIHPTTPCNPVYAFDTRKTAVTDPELRRSVNAPLSDNYPSAIWEFLFDTTRALGDLFMTGSVNLHPNIRWIISHCGAALPSLIDRMALFSSRIQPAQGSNRQNLVVLDKQELRRLLQNQFYFDLAGAPMESQIHHTLKLVDHTRLLFGSDVPFTPFPAAGKAAEAVREGLISIFGVETGVHELMRICHGNAESLFEDRQ